MRGVSNGAKRFLFATSKRNCSYMCREDSSAKLAIMKVVPVDFLRGATEKLRGAAVVLVLTDLVLYVFLTGVLTGKVTNPVRHADGTVRRFTRNSFSIHLPRKEESRVKTVGSIFGRAVRGVRRLVGRIIRVRAIGGSVRFRTLRTRVGPRFLCGMLSAVG